ncbi:MAG: SMP-30/gluconolactonase/LRE family protein [Armatimonadetes bacterium]|nr:SMP-30/gluconolactonase/LRE family protein [Armatimonadota bacterium]
MLFDIGTPGLWRLFDESAGLEQVATGFQFLEGPAWDGNESCLYFSDIPANTLYRWTEKEGAMIFRHPSGMSNGNALDAAGRLVTCEHATRRVSRAEPDGSVVALATRYAGKTLNSPNDIVARSDGSLYFTDPPYGRTARHGIEEPQELDFQGVYRLTPEGDLVLLLDDFNKPNGLAFSPDEKTLYIDDTGRMQIWAYDVRPDGNLAVGRKICQMERSQAFPGGFDGMKVDREGHIYITGPGGLWFLRPDGSILGRLRTPEVAANLAWGDGGKTLYITATSSLYRIRGLVGG